MKRKLLSSLLVIGSCFTLAGCQDYADRDYMAVSTVNRVTEVKNEDGTYKYTILSSGVKTGEVINLEVIVTIDAKEEKIIRVLLNQINESDEYGKALLLGTLNDDSEKAKEFYETYVDIEDTGIKFSSLDRLPYYSKEAVAAVYNEQGTPYTIPTVDLQTGATGTAASYINCLKAAVNSFRNTTK